VRIAVVGTGYVGLTTAVCFAFLDHKVRCVDIDESKIEKINNGVSPIFEEGMDSRLKEVVGSGQLVASTDLEKAVMDSDLSFVCVGTPALDDGSIDLSQIRAVSVSIGKALKNFTGRHIVVIKSTVLPGTSEEVVIPELEGNSGLKVVEDFGVCVNPEFLREGQAISDFFDPKNTGIVIGESDNESGGVLAELYSGFNGSILRTFLRTAEMIKYARNAYLAKDVSFANEIANICSKFSIDYLDVKAGLEMDSRIGKGGFLSAGLGYGGSCFKKDVSAIIRKAESQGFEPSLLKITEEVNERQPSVVLALAKKALGNLNGKKIAVLGLAFKDGTDDVRESRSIKVIELLLTKKVSVVVFDPKAMANAKKILGENVEYAETAKKALDDCDACIITTEWPEFGNPNLYSKKKDLIIIDGRRILDYQLLSSSIIYYGVGYLIQNHRN
tara:strand:- start:958 stop:2286 length:1329 start_codon:yes stop_codon:yes gene_type:complete